MYDSISHKDSSVESASETSSSDAPSDGHALSDGHADGGDPDLPAEAECFVERVVGTAVTDMEVVREQAAALDDLLADRGSEDATVVHSGTETVTVVLAASDDEVAVREAVAVLLREASGDDPRGFGAVCKCGP